LIRFRANNLWQSNIDNGKKNPTFIDDFLKGIRFSMVQLVILANFERKSAGRASSAEGRSCGSGL
jgi:hypothetical protein